MAIMAKIAPPKPTKGIDTKFMIIPPQTEPIAIPVLKKIQDLMQKLEL